MNESYKILSEINVNDKIEKKGRFSYLSWAYAVDELLKVCPDATWEVTKDEGRPYISTPAGCFVEVSVKVGDIVRTQVHPVLNNSNKAISDPDCFQINTSIQRCLVKAIALHGLGLYIYAGEDLPTTEKVSPEPVNKEKVSKAVLFFMERIDADAPEETAEKMKTAYSRLSNDEKSEVNEQLNVKAPGSNKTYKSLLKIHLDYRHG